MFPASGRWRWGLACSPRNTNVSASVESVFFFQKPWTAHLSVRKYKSVCLSSKLHCRWSLSVHILTWELTCWLTKYTLLTHSNGITAHGNTALEEMKLMTESLIGFLLFFVEKLRLPVQSCFLLVNCFEWIPTNFSFLSLCKAWTLWCQSLTLFIMQEQRWSRRMQAKLYPQLGQIPV